MKTTLHQDPEQRARDQIDQMLWQVAVHYSRTCAPTVRRKAWYQHSFCRSALFSHMRSYQALGNQLIIMQSQCTILAHALLLV